MSGTVYKYGRPVSDGEVDYGTIGHGDQRAGVYAASGRDLIVYNLGGWLGRYSGSPKTRLFIGYKAGSGAGSPGTRVAYTQEFSPGVTYVDPAGGDDYVYAITPFYLPGSTDYSLGITCRDGVLAHSMRAAAAISVMNENFYDKSGLSSTVPTNPIGGSGSNQGQMSLWFEGEMNVAPNTPTGLSISSSTDLTPVLYSNFADPNETLNNGAKWDELTQYQIRILQGATVKWDTGAVNANSTEKSQGRSARTYAGPGLLYNTTYTYQIRHRDKLGLWSGYASTTFTITPPNTKPNNPTGLTPSGSLVSSDLSPLLESNFSDPDETLSTGQSWDYLNRYQIRVTRVSDGATMLGTTTYTASTSERNNRKTSREYAGSALAFNTSYKYEVRHEDRMGAWSNWASTTFSITSLSAVEQPLTPAGFVTNKANPGNITAKYTHQSGVAANAMQARILSSGGTVLHTTSVKAVSVANNGTLSMTWAESGFADYINSGNSYRIEVKARDTNNAWSPNWSPYQTIQFNAAPLVPTNLSPTGNTPSGNRPILQATATDVNPETPVQVFAEIMDAAGSTVLQTRELTRVGTSNTFRYQTIAADLPSYAQYSWRAYSYDGHLYSGDTANVALAVRTPLAQFVYAEVPVVTITGPTSPIDTPLPTIQWTAAGQTHFQVLLHRLEDNSLVYDSLQLASTAQQYTLEAGKWLNEKWNNGETFRVTVRVRDTTTLWGTSDPVDLTLEYTPLAALALEVYHHTLPYASTASALRPAWEQTSYAAEDFQAYELTRVEVLADGITERAGTFTRLAEITDPTITELLDAEVTSRQLYKYGVSQRVAVGNDILLSEPTYFTTSIQWDGVMIHCPKAPDSLHVELRYGPPGGDSAIAIQLSQQMTMATPVGTGSRVVFFGKGGAEDPSGDFAIVSDEAGSADEKLEALLTIYRAQRGDWDGRPHIVCWRNGRGGSLGRIYGVMPEPGIQIVGLDEYIVSTSLLEADFSLGLTS